MCRFLIGMKENFKVFAILKFNVNESHLNTHSQLRVLKYTCHKM